MAEEKQGQTPLKTEGPDANAGSAAKTSGKDPGSKTSGIISDELNKNLNADTRQKTDKKEKIFDSNELVKVKIQYPADYKKAKHHKDGQVVEMHPLTAKNYEQNGIGKVIGTVKAKEETREPKEQ